MPPLDRAITLVKIDHVAVIVSQKLDLDVFGALQIFFDINRGITEGNLGFMLGRHESADQTHFIVTDTHAAPAAARRRLDDDGILDLFGYFKSVVFVFDRFNSSRNDRHSGFARCLARGHLVSHGAYRLSAGANEFDLAGFANFCEVGVLR